MGQNSPPVACILNGLTANFRRGETPVKHALAGPKGICCPLHTTRFFADGSP